MAAFTVAAAQVTEDPFPTPEDEPACRCDGSSDFALFSQDWSPPMEQPVRKSRLEYNGGWPAAPRHARLGHHMTARAPVNSPPQRCG